MRKPEFGDKRAQTQELKRLQGTWERLGHDDPMWAVLTRPEKWNEDDFFANGAKEISDVIAYIGSLGIPQHRGLALDFGCGLGRLTRALADHYEEVVGVDVASSMIENARGMNASVPNCEFKHNPALDLGCFESESFDFVYSSITLQHMVPALAKGYIAEFLRVVRPEGLVLFQVSDRRKDRSASASAGHLRRKITKLRHTPSEGRKLLMQKALRRTMEMHCVPESEVVKCVGSAGGSIVDVQPDDAAGALFDSNRYAVVRAETPDGSRPTE